MKTSSDNNSKSMQQGASVETIDDLSDLPSISLLDDDNEEIDDNHNDVNSSSLSSSSSTSSHATSPINKSRSSNNDNTNTKVSLRRNQEKNKPKGVGLTPSCPEDLVGNWTVKDEIGCKILGVSTISFLPDAS